MKMKYHGKDVGVKFSYVWARPKHKGTLMMHIAKRYEGTLQNNGVGNLFGKTYFKCAYYNEIWKNERVSFVPFTKYPSHKEGCYWCWNRVEEFEAKIEQAKMLQNPMEINPGFSDDEIATFSSRRSDEEDIVIEDDFPEWRRGLTTRNSIEPPYFECVKCLRRYAMESAAHYKPADNTGIVLKSYGEHSGSERKAEIYKCFCGHPILIQVVGTITTWSRIIVGRPVIK